GSRCDLRARAARSRRDGARMNSSVLIVDDDPYMVRTLCDVLRRRGYRTRGVHSGEEAVAVAEEQSWSAVVMDIRMAGMNGVETFRALRDRDPRVRVILMTAYSSPDLLREAEDAGVRRVLAKPFAIPELLETLRRELQGGAGDRGAD